MLVSLDRMGETSPRTYRYSKVRTGGAYYQPALSFFSQALAGEAPPSGFHSNMLEAHSRLVAENCQSPTLLDAVVGLELVLPQRNHFGFSEIS